MKNLIKTYNQINESNELTELSFEEIERLAELGILDEDLLKIYNYVKSGSTKNLILDDSELTHLPNWLLRVYDSLYMRRSNIEDIPDNLVINGSIFADNSKLKEFRRTEAFVSLNLEHTKITKLPDNLKVGGYLSVEGIQFEKIPIGLQIHGHLLISGSNLEQFTNEELYDMYTIRGDIWRQHW